MRPRRRAPRRRPGRDGVGHREQAVGRRLRRRRRGDELSGQLPVHERVHLAREQDAATRVLPAREPRLRHADAEDGIVRLRLADGEHAAGAVEIQCHRVLGRGDADPVVHQAAVLAGRQCLESRGGIQRGEQQPVRGGAHGSVLGGHANGRERRLASRQAGGARRAHQDAARRRELATRPANFLGNEPSPAAPIGHDPAGGHARARWRRRRLGLPHAEVDQVELLRHAGQAARGDFAADGVETAQDDVARGALRHGDGGGQG